MKAEYFKVIAEFAVYEKKHPEDPTLDFFLFLEQNYPTVWAKLNEFYADDTDCGDDVSREEAERVARLARHGWDRLLKPDQFPMFLNALQRIWPTLSGRELGECPQCKQETELEREHNVIVSYSFGPVFKVYEHYEMDGSVAEEVYCCRECALKSLLHLVNKMDPEKETCWV